MSRRNLMIKELYDVISSARQTVAAIEELKYRAKKLERALAECEQDRTALMQRNRLLEALRVEAVSLAEDVQRKGGV